LAKKPDRFAPQDAHIRVIKALRYFDGQFVRMDIFTDYLNDQLPLGDLEQALINLRDVEWVENTWHRERGSSYKLSGEGLNFARKRSFPVMSVGEREEFIGLQITGRL
jgi:hypothetical protein